MKITIADVLSTLNAKEEFTVAAEQDRVRWRGLVYPVTKKEPFQLCLVNNDNKKLLIAGDAHMTVTLPCDLCLSDVPTAFDLSIRRELAIRDGAVVSEDKEESAFLEGAVLDVDRLIYDELLVNWPTKILCREDCKGLCPVCGQNLNVRDCGCDRQVADPRMARFQEIFDQCKEV